jgi:hypothetical protein
MSRGDRREAIFHDDADRQEFLRSLGQACLKTGWQVHAYCLMNNHFHLVIETPHPKSIAGNEVAPGHLHGNDSIGGIGTGVISLADVTRRN